MQLFYESIYNVLPFDLFVNYGLRIRQLTPFVVVKAVVM